jgi:hypothetical protein
VSGAAADLTGLVSPSAARDDIDTRYALPARQAALA